MKIIYTEAAQQEMAQYHAQANLLLEELIKERKFVMGDEVIEVTASDVKSATYNLRVAPQTLMRSRLPMLLSRLYMLIGLFMIAGAFLYPYIIDMLQSNRQQALLLISGTALTALGAFSWILMGVRQSRIDVNQIERGLRERQAKFKQMIEDIESAH